LLTHERFWIGEHIRLNDCDQITGRGLDAVGTLSRLKELQLSNTQVTDDGIAKLRSLKRLELLFWTKRPSPTSASRIWHS
jgi:hypothetical protein